MNSIPQSRFHSITLAACGIFLFLGIVYSVSTFIYDVLLLVNQFEWKMVFALTSIIFSLISLSFAASIYLFWWNGVDGLALKDWFKLIISYKSLPNVLRCLMASMNGIAIFLIFLAYTCWFVDLFIEDYSLGMRLIGLGSFAVLLAFIYEKKIEIDKYVKESKSN